MPRIDAPTVAEHHAMRRTAILAAARELLGAGVHAVTPAAVASRSGLARTSVYQYYPSTGALLAAAVEATFADADRTLSAAVGQAGEPRARVHTYVRQALRLAARDHGAFRHLAPTDLPPDCAARLSELHEDLLAPLRSAVADVGVREPAVVAALVFGAISAAVTLLDHGRPLEETIEATVAFVDAGLDASR